MNYSSISSIIILIKTNDNLSVQQLRNADHPLHSSTGSHQSCKRNSIKNDKNSTFDDRDISLISVPVPFQTDTRYNITTVGFLNTSLGNVCRMCVRHFLQNR